MAKNLTIRFKFTPKGLADLEPRPDGKRYFAHDEKKRGLAVAVTPKSKTFYLYKKIAGRPERIRIGRVDEMSITRARLRVDEFNADIIQGRNPADKRRALSAQATVRELFDSYLRSKPHLRPKTSNNYENQFKNYIARLSLRKISDVRRADIQAVLNKVTRDGGPYQANRIRALLHAMFEYAVDQGFEGKNPVAGIKRNPERSRERFLQARELEAFFAALAASPADARHLFTVLLLTGARKGNVLSMAWDDVNLDGAVWIIPGDRAKAHESIVIPLCDEVLGILKARAALTESPYVFPGRNPEKHLVEPRNWWNDILKRAGIHNLRMHDLRRSLGSWMAAGGVGLPIIGKALGHRDQSTTQIYAKLNVEPVRIAMDAATRAMLTAGGQLDPVDVDAEVVR